MTQQPPEPEHFGPFKFYGPLDEVSPGWALSYEGEWLPGSYADKEALMLICGLFLAESNTGLVDELMELLQARYNRARPSVVITAEHILNAYRPRNC